MLDKVALCVLGSTERMAIHQTKHQTDLEKRLQLLKRQVYGKSTDQPIYRHTDIPISSSTPVTSDLSYLHRDLLKILIFASVAISAQAILFFLLKNQILNINFF